MRAGDHGPTVGPDDLGPSGPAWVITSVGYTPRGRPWFVIRKRGGPKARVTLHATIDDEDMIRTLIDAHVRRLQPLPAETGD